MTNPKSGGSLNSLRGMSRASALTLLSCTLFSSVSVSAAAAPTYGPELQKWHRVDRFEVKTPYSDTNAGAARGNVDAPEDVVRAVVLDYKNYASFISRFEKSRVLFLLPCRRRVLDQLFEAVEVVKQLLQVAVAPVLRSESGPFEPVQTQIIVGAFEDGAFLQLGKLLCEALHF